MEQVRRTSERADGGTPAHAMFLTGPHYVISWLMWSFKGLDDNFIHSHIFSVYLLYISIVLFVCNRKGCNICEILADDVMFFSLFSLTQPCKVLLTASQPTSV